MKAKLFCKTGQLAGAEYQIAGAATIGKNLDNSIVLYPNIISGRHARIFFDEKKNCYFLEDLGSRNGTKLDGVRVAEKEKLGNLHVITFAGAFDFIFHAFDDVAQPASRPRPELRQTVVGKVFTGAPPNLEEEEKKSAAAVASPKAGETIIGEGIILVPELPSAEETPEEIAQAPSAANAAVSPSFCLELKIIMNEIRTYALMNGENIVGRSQDCHISVDNFSLSRRHAIFTVASGKVTVKDLGSKNRTLVEDKEIEPEMEMEILPGTRVKLGMVEGMLVRKT
jgi:pSer/pThr/pTyr-binding forkhead associated (FHA) protein